MDDDIIRMARESGWSFMEAGMDAQRLARFAALVRADEREACARIAERSPEKHWCAANIRARNHQPPATVADRLARHGILMPDDENPSFG